jgi:hypothetical protein
MYIFAAAIRENDVLPGCRRFSDNFLKKVYQKFGSFKKMTYLCTRFRL